MTHRWLFGAACLAFVLSNPAIADAQTAASPIVVTVTAKGCDLMELTVPAGTVTFQIVNKSSRALEWEILKGVMVVDERENIAPGFKQKLTTTLEPGEYAITCGLLSNPRGKLTVLGSGTQAAFKPSAFELVAPSAEYRVWLAGQLSMLAGATDAVRTALDSGAPETAWPALIDVEAVHLRLAPAAALAPAEDKALGDALRSLEQSVSGSDKAQAAVQAKALSDAGAAFSVRVKGQLPSADQLILGASKASETFAASLRDAQSQSRRTALVARLAGIDRVVSLFQPLALKADKAKSEKLTTILLGLKAGIDKLPEGGTTLTDEDRLALTAAADALSKDVASLSAMLGT